MSFDSFPSTARAMVRLSAPFKQLTAGIALEPVVQHIVRLAGRRRFAEWFAIPSRRRIRDRAVGEVIARHRYGLPHAGGDYDPEFDVKVLARGAHLGSFLQHF